MMVNKELATLVLRNILRKKKADEPLSLDIDLWFCSCLFFNFMCLQQDKFALFKNLQIVKWRHMYAEKSWKNFPLKRQRTPSLLFTLFKQSALCTKPLEPIKGTKHKPTQDTHRNIKLKKKLTPFFTFIRGITPTALKQITYTYSDKTSLLGISLRSQPLLQKVTSAELIRLCRWVGPSLQIKLCETSTKDRNKLFLAFYNHVRE